MRNQDFQTVFVSKSAQSGQVWYETRGILGWRTRWARSRANTMAVDGYSVVKEERLSREFSQNAGKTLKKQKGKNNYQGLYYVLIKKATPIMY